MSPWSRASCAQMGQSASLLLERWDLFLEALYTLAFLPVISRSRQPMTKPLTRTTRGWAAVPRARKNSLSAAPGLPRFLAFCSSVSLRHIWNIGTVASFLRTPTFHLGTTRRGSVCPSPTRFSLPLAVLPSPHSEAGRGGQMQCQMGGDRGVGRHTRQTHLAGKTRS